MKQNMFKTTILKAFEKGGLPEPTEKQLDQFDIYFNCLIEQNKTTNLTTITDPEKAATDHFYDSAMPLFLIEDRAKIIDVGTGAGFPIVPLAIMKSNAKCTAIDSVGKKCEFIKSASKAADIDLNVVSGRAEELARQDFRDSFDICVSRAVARLNVLIELCSPFVVAGGRFFAYKSDPAEVQEAESAAEKLNLKLELCVPSLISGNGRKIFIYRKTAQTPKKYPRAYAKIKKSPL